MSSVDFATVRPPAFMQLPPTTLLQTASPFLCSRFVIGLSCIVFLGLLGPDVHAETCGNYLFKNGQPVSVSHKFSHADTTAAATRHQQQLPALPKAPCNGPGCRKQSVPLAPPPVAPVSVTASDPAAILDFLLSANTCVDGIVSPQSEKGEHWVAKEVFRPPTA